jgi:hypothetical protein
MKYRLGLAVMFTFLAGCASVQAPPVRTVQILENSGTEFPTMCMLLQSDGSLVFRGGFQFYNPSAWRREARDGDKLVITLGGTAEFPTDVYKEQLPKHIGGLTGYDEKRREIVYRFDASVPFLNFGNFYFYRVDACHAG